LHLIINFPIHCFWCLVINFDAKLSFDDNAKFRQSEIFDMEDTTESDPREVEATRAGLNYIGLQGNIGCLGKSNYLI
jgi:succinyl-CoA synthetase beta subunit